ncbi:UDP-N-acetylmuramoyl-tripeptide--D-alanyl-D-alanine ligase [Amylibacter ulvae]|uniref:UDP-N-acetylmuramoyl-tripeptide--D-alanyl-D-alanine ligase n=1 Tax=Paramylibacter ulvae TaxID=1651968 RepID=A0ABQ3D1G2_9RHOB|nr:UDP-N-acetylmuramoyl-tripeptide--D-alanyl-D-alanine ligase [Amylibacter ulvae]GHA52709.1 UDP-N-acetylmuramoyl-tripeptide--D-alanyl-D-alanine ligase [Amylibacter ulvae]
MNLWTSQDAVLATGGRSTTDWVANGLSIDTREIEAGDIFVALKDQRDGHDFVAQALEKGAAAALVSRIPNGVSSDAPLLIVDDVLHALENMARFARNRTSAKVIGVTGSVGKTGTKEMLRTALAGQGRVHAAERSFNNHWGVPLTLARMPMNTDYAVIEIGMNHPNEITPLARMADLDVAIVTTVAAVHMAAFKDVDEIAHAKAEIFDGLRKGGTAVINIDIPTAQILRDGANNAGAKLIEFGQTDGADYHLGDVIVGNDTTNVSATAFGDPIMFKLSAPGKHLAMNALAVLAGAVGAGADLAMSMLALQDFTAPSGRGARQTIELANIDGASLELIDESYNANPTSVGASLDVLAAAQPIDNVGRIRKGRRIAMLGDMLELGPDERQMHAELADHPAIARVDIVHSAGALMQSLHDALPVEKRGTWFADAQQMADKTHQLLDAGDVVMVKGSLGSRLALVVKSIQKLQYK